MNEMVEAYWQNSGGGCNRVAVIVKATSMVAMKAFLTNLFKRLRSCVRSHRKCLPEGKVPQVTHHILDSKSAREQGQEKE